MRLPTSSKYWSKAEGRAVIRKPPERSVHWPSFGAA
jgi:hypothetical protein